MEAFMRSLAAAAGEAIPDELEIDLICSAENLNPQQDAQHAQKLDGLLTAAAARGTPINISNNEGFRPPALVQAAQGNGTERVRVLIKHGADVDAAWRRFNETPLHMAAKQGSLEIVRMLLGAGANPLLKDCIGNTPLDLATNPSASSNPDQPLGARARDDAVRLEIAALLQQHMASYKERPKAQSTSSSSSSSSSKTGSSNGASSSGTGRGNTRSGSAASGGGPPPGQRQAMLESLLQAFATQAAGAGKGMTKEVQMYQICCAESVRPQQDTYYAQQLHALLTDAESSGSPIDINSCSDMGEGPPLVRAALMNGIERIKVLLKHGADVNVVFKEYDETALHIAARYGYIDIARVLLDAGANPLLLDCYGNTPLDLLNVCLEKFNPLQWPSAATRKHAEAVRPEFVKLLKQHMARYENHLRTRSAKHKAANATRASAKSSSSSSSSSNSTASRHGAAPSPEAALRAAAAAAAGAAGLTGATAVGSSVCDLCGKGAPPGGKIMRCSKCKLRGYCSKECQKADWPTHKAPCKMIADVKQRAVELLDTSQPDEIRWSRARSMSFNANLQQLAVDLKLIPQFLAAMEGDKAVKGYLPTMVAVCGLIRDDTVPKDQVPAFGPMRAALHPAAVEMFVAAGGPLTILKALAGPQQLCREQLVDALRAVSAVLYTWTACKPLVKKGIAAELVQRLAVHMRSRDMLVLANACMAMSRLMLAEQQLLALQQQQQQQQGQEVDSQQQQEQQQLPPVLAAVFAHADFHSLVAPIPELCGTAPGNYCQACMEVFPNLLHTKGGYNTFKSQHTAEFKWMLDNAICGLAFDQDVAVACGLQTLYLVYKHGGLEDVSKYVGPALLKYPQEFDPNKSVPPNIMKMRPGEQHMCQLLFVLLIVEAAGMKKDTVQLGTGVVKVHRAAVLLLKAVWDAVPRIRPVFGVHKRRMREVLKQLGSSSKDGKVLESLLKQMR